MELALCSEKRQPERRETQEMKVMLNGARREKVLGTRRGADLRQEVTVVSLFTLNRTENGWKASSLKPPVVHRLLLLQGSEGDEWVRLNKCAMCDFPL